MRRAPRGLGWGRRLALCVRSLSRKLAHARRPSYHEPSSPVGEVEVGVAYSQEEEMAGRLHAELERMKKEGSGAQLAPTAA